MKHISTPALGALLFVAAGACSAAHEASPAAGSADGAGGRAAVAGDRLEPAALGTTARVHRFGNVYLASQPKAADLAQAKAAGVKTVLDLRPESENRGFDEPATLATLGLKYVNVPFASPEAMTDDVLDRVRTALRTAERPLLVHCSSANRVGAVWIAWRAIDGGLALDDAVAEAQEVGLKSPELEGRARAYVDRMAAAHR